VHHCNGDLAEGATDTINCCGGRLHVDCQTRWVAFCLEGKAADAQSRSAEVPGTPRCVCCRVECGTSARARNGMWG